MKNSLLLSLLFTISASAADAQVTYFADLMGKGFKQATIVQPSDYEGSVTCTLVRKTTPDKSTKAVLYVHGFNDYFFQEEMAERYIKEGFNFYAIDLRKYGRSWLSHQKINNIRDLSEYYADIDTALAVIKGEGNEKVLLSGHSLGGLTISLYASERAGKEKFDAVLLNSPMFALNIKSGLKKTALPLLLKRAEKHPETTFDLGINPLYGESLHITAHGEWSYSLGLKPFVAPPVNLGWIRAVYNAQERLTQGITINKPVLVLHSTKSIDEKKWSDVFFTGDAVLNVEEIARLSQNIVGQYSIQAVQGGMHDLILSKQPVRDEVYSTIFNWAKRTVK
ncbi:alpha/beta hydrolase [Dyadobacter jiangsuensis]|uniref:Alpha-beta hydrolase superfamily lysophospholipase n=1 Tax=Dyadobacter jiangsuensis TaxID=1591085 RepID=A0A2P8G193_9BACT|nr:alpha/beta hydrolase [Dyadobacter jiangsuensis]PSL27750.1 alpha-beta hydrolase superfamily lysophospholipase [Dyadobacter jiangsuensis]